MEKPVETGGRLRDMLLAARCVDTGLVELEKMLMSIEGLMPDESNKEAALEAASSLFQEVKDVEVNIEQLTNIYKSLFEATKEENDKADVAIKSMQDGINQIEDTLRNYGYDSSNMPELIPEEMEENGSIIEDSESSVEEVKDEADDEVPLSPGREIEAMSESLLGVEITPMLLSGKSRKNSHNSASSTGTTPLPCFKQTSVPVTCVPIIKYENNAIQEKKESNQLSKKLLQKPERPVLSLNY
ncbi:uncharacterized protein LOC117642330 [Thrips palmi]|uniref:Uncharacterized protein LOC117642330 n=1 Tax=Thrips palmi TaxID=161013 RepID=A0A6P8YQE2_THRPL|nr:uncharacterized protein LOC117642330 [Thrips palmi]